MSVTQNSPAAPAPIPLWKVSTEDLLQEIQRRSIASAVVMLQADAGGEKWRSSFKGGIELTVAVNNRLNSEAGAYIARLFREGRE